jgi:hypothetical protein
MIRTLDSLRKNIFTTDEANWVVQNLVLARAGASQAEAGMIDRIGEKMGMDPGWYEILAEHDSTVEQLQCLLN